MRVSVGESQNNNERRAKRFKEVLLLSKVDREICLDFLEAGDKVWIALQKNIKSLR